jgi:ANTAR domain/GAF domain
MLRALLVGRSPDGSALERLCAGAVSALPVDGAAISMTTGGTAGRDLVGASDAVTARLDDLQSTLGEGPCQDAARDGRAVLVGDLTGPAGLRWPMFTDAALAAGFRAVFAFPLQIGVIRLGTLALVRARPGGLERGALAHALIVADVAALTLIGMPVGDPEDASDLRSDVSSMYRAEIHQATGMLMAQLGVSAQEALVRLRAHAYARGQTADEVAR